MALTSVGSWPADDDLVASAQSGERAALDELARRHRRSAYLLALQLTGNPDDAMDLSQEAMLRFFHTLERVDPTRPVRPWLLRIVRNLVTDHWRRARVRRAESLDAPGADVSLQIRDPEADPARDARRSELRRRLWRELSGLAPALREILVLRDYHDLAYREIADVLKIPQGTVMSRLHRARRELRRRLLETSADLLGEHREERSDTDG